VPRSSMDSDTFKLGVDLERDMETELDFVVQRSHLNS
jgi:hypothetical protein